jgi:hypothetical protein
MMSAKEAASATTTTTRKRRSTTDLIKDKKRLHDTRRQKHQHDEQIAVNACRELRDQWIAQTVRWGHMLLMHAESTIVDKVDKTDKCPTKATSATVPDDARPIEPASFSMEDIHTALDVSNDGTEISESVVLEAWQGKMRQLWNIFLFYAPHMHVNTQVRSLLSPLRLTFFGGWKMCQRAIQFFEHKYWKESVQVHHSLNILTYVDALYQALVRFVKQVRILASLVFSPSSYRFEILASFVFSPYISTRPPSPSACPRTPPPSRILAWQHYRQMIWRRYPSTCNALLRECAAYSTVTLVAHAMCLSSTTPLHVAMRA